jgi:hypothetical protein
MYEAMTTNFPELARQAIITAFLFKNQNRWDDEDQSLEQLGRNDDGDDVDEDGEATDDFSGLFDEGDRDER